MSHAPHSATSPAPRSDWFATTHWSVVLAAGRDDCPAARQALEDLCRTYWYPLYVFVRRQGFSHEDAQDLTQEFFARLLERNDVAQAEPRNGRFRAFLLARLKHFLSDQRDRRRAAKRGGNAIFLSLDAGSAQDRYALEPVDSTTPEKLFERRWAMTLLARARDRLRQEFACKGKLELFEQLTEMERNDESRLTYAEIARRRGTTESAIKAAAHNMRQRGRELLRAEIAQTVATVPEIDEEIRHLLAVLRE